MNYEITARGELKITANLEERSWLAELMAEHREGGKPLLDTEAEALEGLIANSELEWLPEGVTGDLTSAPMLGITGNKGDVRKPSFGEVYGHPIIARWAYMSYQVRSFISDLIDTGECVWQGGYADKPELEYVDVIASGYEWMCQDAECGRCNKEIEYIEKVKCRGCGREYLTRLPEHAYGN